MSAPGFFKKNRAGLIFLALLIAMFFVYRYPYSIQKGPFSIHYWRQSNGTSLALNYAKEDIGFFEPTIHWTGNSDSGKSIGEFPLIYFIVGKIWKLTGHRPFIFRLLNLLIFYTGLFYLFRFLKEFLEDNFWAIVLPLLLFTSPVLVYYANNTLMNAPSFGLVLVGAYYYWKYQRTGKTAPLYLSMLIFLLAGLLKPTALILFTGILIIHLLLLIRRLRKAFNISLRSRPIHLIPFAVVILGNIAWFQWVKNYNSNYVGGIFLQGIIPIWQAGLKEGLYIGTLFYNEVLGKFFNQSAFYLCILLFVWLLYKFRDTNLFLMSLTLLAFGGSLFYIILFYMAMSVHDYYLLNLVIVFPLILVTFLDYLRTNHPDLYRDRALKGTAIVGLILCVYGTMVVQRARYDLNDTFVKHTIILNQKEKDLYRYYQTRYSDYFEALESIEPYLRSLGIKREDKVLSIPDGTPNFTLYLMDQKGITDYGYTNLDETEKIEHIIRTGGKYLIINDPAILSRESLKPYTRDKIGQYKNVSIYRLESQSD